MRTQPRSRAFTLIELLVVIAIIAILTSLLFTVLSSSRQKSNQTTSLNNLKQWGAALNRCLGDFNGEMPSLGTTGETMNLDDQNAWFNRLPRYLDERPLDHPDYKEKPPKPGDRSVWINPAVPKEDGAKFVDPPSKFLFCYAMNSYLSTTADPLQPINRIERPAATVFMAEKGDDVPFLEPKEIRAYFGAGDPLTDPKNGAHFLYCDGHVELRTRVQFDPELMKTDPSNPSPIDSENLNAYFTYIPFRGATKE